MLFEMDSWLYSEVKEEEMQMEEKLSKLVTAMLK